MLRMKNPNTIVLFIFVGLISHHSVAQEATTFNDVVAQAAAAAEQNDLPRALELYKKALELNPRWAQGWWFLGSLQYDAGQYASARDALTRFIEFGENHGPAYALRGMCEVETGEYADALADIRRGIAHGGADDERNEQALHFYEGLVLTRLGRFDQALQSYRFFAARKVTDPEVFLAIGLAGLRMTLLPKDATNDQRALVAASGTAAYQFLAGDEKSAMAAFNNLFQRFPTAANTHYLYGWLLYPSERDAALEEFQRELKLNPANENARVMVAWTLLMRNDPSDALPLAQQEAGAQPELASAQLVLGRSLWQSGKLNEGIAHLERALQLQPDNLEVHIALAGAYSQSGRTEDARRERAWCLEATNDGTTRIALP
jgi:tetratricopeptide (TPR) repeat protein